MNDPDAMARLRQTAKPTEPPTGRRPHLRRRAMAALVCVFLILGGVILVSDHIESQVRLNQCAHEAAQRVQQAFSANLHHRAAVLNSVLDELDAHPALAEAMAAGDRQALLAASEPIFQRLRHQHEITHLYFHDPKRVNFLRTHCPPRHGDRIDRYTAIGAERTGNQDWGIELGPLGTFTLRAVRPWRVDGQLLGYLEVGQEIDRLIALLPEPTGADLVVLIQKNYLDRDGWQAGMEMLGRGGDWDALPHHAVIDQTLKVSPTELRPWLQAAGPPQAEGPVHLAWGPQSRTGVFLPLRDAGGRRVGSLLTLSDMTASRKAAWWHLAGVTLQVVAALVLLCMVSHRALGKVQRELADRADRLAATNRQLTQEMAARQRVEEAQAEQVRFLQQILDAIPSPLFYKDTAGRYLGVNRALAEALELAPEEMIGRTAAQLFEPDLASRYERADRELLNNPGTQVYEGVIASRRGRRMDVLFNKATYTDAQGRVAGILGVAVDLTQRKVAEQAALREYHRLEAMVSSMDQGVCLIDAGGLVLEVNDQFGRLTRTAKADLLGRRLEQLERYEALAPACRQAELFARDGKKRPVSYDLKLGRYQVMLQVSPVRSQGEYAGLILSAVDVTELVEARQRAEKAQQELHDRAEDLEAAQQALMNMIDDMERREVALQKSNEFQQYILDTAATSILLFDANRKITSVNREFCQVTGYRPEEVIGRTCSALRCDGCKNACIMNDSCQGAVSKRECTIHAKDGRALRILKNAVVLRDAEGQITGGIESFVDVTELVTARESALVARDELEETNRHLEEAIERSNEMAVRAEMAAQSKAEFLANMSHEIRTPMTAILGYADLLAEPGLAAEEHDQHLQVIRRNGEHLLELINDILDLSKIEAHRLELSPSPCSPACVVADVASLMRIRAAQKGIDLHVTYETALPETIVLDESRLRQSLVNLVGNAVKFTDTGSVDVRVRFLEAGLGDDPAVQFDVVDTGVGIPRKKLKDLFQPFVQADSSTSRQFGGTGLGLAITRHLMELMGGRVEVDSQLGSGSRFTLTLPAGAAGDVTMLEDPAEAIRGRGHDEMPEHIPADLLAGRRILLAEDGPDNQRLIAAVLKKAGARVTLAENGQQACQHASSEGFDLVLMDMQMPLMDGYQATSHLRAEGYDSPILALTAHAMASDRAKCLAAGCDDYLTKPIDRPVFLATVARYAAEGRNAGDAPAENDNDPSDAADEDLDSLAAVDLSEDELLLDAPAEHPDAPAGDAAAEEPAQTHRPAPAGTEPDRVLISQFADEADLGDLIVEFAGELPGRLAKARSALEHNDHESARRVFHQLKGAGGSYGYPMLSEAALAAEDAIKAADIEAARVDLATLARLAKAICAGCQLPYPAEENLS